MKMKEISVELGEYQSRLQALRDKRSAEGRPQWLAKVERAKKLQFLFKYRIGGPRKWWVVVPWCPPPPRGDRLIMTVDNPWPKIKRGFYWGCSPVIWAYRKYQARRKYREIMREFETETKENKT